MASTPAPPSLARRLLRLGLVIGVFLLLMHVVSPFLVSTVPGLREYARVVDETGITPGSLFYTDVPQTVDGEFNNRDAIRYRVKRGD